MLQQLIKRIRGTSTIPTCRSQRQQSPQCHAAIEILESRELLTGASASTAVLTPMIAPPAVPAQAGSANSLRSPTSSASHNEQHDAGQCQRG